MLWEVLKIARIPAERQYEIRERDTCYNLDFAVECGDGAKIAIECDGDTYHSSGAARDQNRRRNTDLITHGWLVLRFGTDGPVMIWISLSSAAMEPKLTSNAMAILTIRPKLRETVIGAETPT
jgi:hypothetical protein